MHLIGRYIFRQIVFAFALTLIMLVLVLWLSQALDRFSLIMSQGQTMLLFLRVTMLALPSLIVVIAPVAMVIAIVHVLNRLNNDSELVVVTAAGAARMRVVAPVMAVAFIVAALTAVISLYLQPITSLQLRMILKQVNVDIIASMAQEGQFTKIDDLTLHIQSRDPDGTLRGLLLHDMRDRERVSTYLAERGRIVEENDSSYLLMENGSLQRAGETPESITMVSFDRYVYDLSQLSLDSSLPEINHRERSTWDLLFPDTSEAYYQKHRGRFRAELHERVSTIFYPLAFASIALATIGFARTSRESRIQLVVVAVVSIITLRILGFTMMSLAREAVWPVFAMYALPLGTLALTLTVAFGHARALENLVQHLWDRIPFARIARKSGLTRTLDLLRPKLQAMLRQAGLSG